MAKNKHVGPTLDDFLAEDGILEATNALAQKKLVALQLRDAMTALDLSEAALARRMRTSRTIVRKLLDPDNDSATLVTLARAAAAVGLTLRVSFEKKRTRPARAPKRRLAA
jgi:antitoxin HicB